MQTTKRKNSRYGYIRLQILLTPEEYEILKREKEKRKETWRDILFSLLEKEEEKMTKG